MPRSAKYPEHLIPSTDLRAVWKQRGDMLDDPDYDTRWVKYWKAVLDQLRDQGTWDDRDVGLLAEFVEWSRLADDHQREAEDAPYRVHAESGRVFAHPGFAHARDARREAREVRRELGLGPDGRAAAGLTWGDPGGGSNGDESDQEGL